MWKVVSWNVNSIKARKDRLFAFLDREKPDVVCLQELKGTDETFPFESLRERGYHAAVWGQKTYNGVAILSRSEPRGIRRGFEDGGETASRFVEAEIDGVHVLCAYFPNGQAVGTEKFQYKLEWFRRLRQYLDRHHARTEKLILAGDFNVAPADIDVHDPDAWRGQILFSEPEKTALREIVGFGLHDTFRARHPETQAFSWWDYRMLGFPKNRGLRIDLILASGPLRERLQEAWIDRNERKGTGASDHAPVIAEFEL